MQRTCLSFVFLFSSLSSLVASDSTSSSRTTTPDLSNDPFKELSYEEEEACFNEKNDPHHLTEQQTQQALKSLKQANRGSKVSCIRD